MLRRSVAFAAGNLSGNRVLGIRREDKNVWERRVPLTPPQVHALLKSKAVAEVVVQPSTIRCFQDSDYAEVGATVEEDLSRCGTIVAVKEVPGQLLLPDRSYLFFSHTIKAQPYNMPLLDTILSKNIRLFDYERIVGSDGRMVKFGPYAGFAGTVDTLHALGLALLTKGLATPFLHVSLARDYRSLDSCRNDLRITGDLLRTRGLPKECAPLIIAVTGSGSVSLAAQQILHLLPCKYVEVEDLPKIAKLHNPDRHCIYVTVVKAKDMVKPKDPSKQFDRADYYKNPENYESVFQERVAPYVQVILNGIYWEPRFPRMLTTAQARQLSAENRFPLMCLGDITCDVGGSIEFFVKATTIQNPLYAYDVKNEQVIEMHDYNGQGVVILGVDHLPAEFPCESSGDFGTGLVPLIRELVSSKADLPLAEQKAALGPHLFNSMITWAGALTPNFAYIADLRKAREAAVEKNRRVLVIGSGMCAGPCVQQLLSNRRNTVTLVDASAKALDAVKTHFAAGHEPDRSSQDKNNLRCIVADFSKIDEYLESLIAQSDVVVSLLPAPMHAAVAKVAIAKGVSMVTASYESPAMRELRGEIAAAKNVVVLNETGLDPGIDIMSSVDIMNRIRSEGGIVKKYISLCGALPAPENTDCPMGYKFSWSPRGVLSAALRPARFSVGSKWFDVAGKHLFYLVQGVRSFKGLDLYWLPNGDSERYAQLYDLTKDVDVVVRGTLRYCSFGSTMRGFGALKLLDETNKFVELIKGGPAITWPALLKRLMEAPETADFDAVLSSYLTRTMSATRAEVAALPVFQALKEGALLGGQPFPVTVDDDTASIVKTMAALGLTNPDGVVPQTSTGTPIDSLCAELLPRMLYTAHERDFVLMMHRITAYFPKENVTKTYVSTLSQRGETSQRTATGTTVGVPLAMGAQLVLDGGLAGAGLVLPTDRRVYEPLLDQLAKAGIQMHETVEVEKH